MNSIEKIINYSINSLKNWFSSHSIWILIFIYTQSLLPIVMFKFRDSLNSSFNHSFIYSFIDQKKKTLIQWNDDKSLKKKRMSWFAATPPTTTCTQIHLHKLFMPINNNINGNNYNNNFNSPNNWNNWFRKISFLLFSHNIFNYTENIKNKSKTKSKRKIKSEREKKHEIWKAR